MCVVQLLLLIFGLGLMFRGRLHLGRIVVGKPYAAIAGGCLAAPVVLSGAILVGSWLFAFFCLPHFAVTADYRWVSLNPGGLRGIWMLLIDVVLIVAGLFGAGISVVVGAMAADPKEKAAASRPAVTKPPLFHDQAVRAGMTCQARHYLVGRAFGQMNQWQEVAEALAKVLQASNARQPRVNWNIRVLDAAAAVEMNLNAVEMRTLAQGRFPVVWVKLVYDGERLKPNDLQILEQEFDLRLLGA